MKTHEEDVTTVDPDDVAAASAWSARRAAAAHQLHAAQAELAGLRHDLDQPAAKAAVAELAAARASTAGAKSTADDAVARAATATNDAARYEANQLAAAQTAVDDATRALSVALADLLRQASASTALTATVDGLALRQRYLAGRTAAPAAWDHTTVPFRAGETDPPLDPQLVFPAVGSADYAGLIAVLDRLDARADAVADLMTAESVHHLVQGNLVRSGAALDIAASGTVPDSFEVIRTPRSGDAMTHRILVLHDAGATPHWSFPERPGSLADPLLSTWLTGVLPPPAAIGVRVSRTEHDSATRTHTRELTLDALDLDPLGLARIATDPGDLVQRIALLARRLWTADLGEAAYDGAVVIEPGTAAYQLDDLAAAASPTLRLLGSARGLSPDDLSRPDEPVQWPAKTVDTMAARTGQVESALTATVNALEAAESATDRLDIADALVGASEWAIAGATPQLDRAVPELGVLRAQASQARAELTKRLVASPFEPVDGDAALTVRRARARLATLLGWQSPGLVELPAATTADWAPVFGGAPLAGADAATLRSWLDSYAQVRPATSALLDLLDVAEALDFGEVLRIDATQLLRDGSDGAWHGADPVPPAGLVHVVVQRGFPGRPQTVSGLAVDAWTQRTPGGEQHPAVAYHHNGPDSEPPQVALVAVAPDLSPDREPQHWDLETLCDVLLATLTLARERATAAENAITSGITLRGAR